MPRFRSCATPLPRHLAHTRARALYWPLLLRVFVYLCLKIPVERGVSIEELAARTNRFSGADIHLLCREASMMPMRRLLVGKTPDDILRMRSEGLLRAPAVTMADFNAAVLRTNPSVSDGDITRFSKWEAEFGST